MGWLDALAQRLGYIKAQQPDPAPPFTAMVARLERDMLDPYADAMTNARLYERLSWLQQAIGRVATTAATVPLHVVRRVDEQDEEQVSHPFEQLLQRPNPMDSRNELLVNTVSFLLLTGNAYWWLSVSDEDAPPDELWLLPSQFVEPLPDERLWIRGYRLNTGNGTPQILEPHEIVHFKMFNPNSHYSGMSPLDALRTVARGDLAAQQWNTAFFAEGNAKPAGALAFSDHIADPEWIRLQEELKAQHGGTRRSLMLLRSAGSGVAWVPMALNQSEMQFIEGREFTKQEVYDHFAPGLLSMTSVNATEASSNTGYKVFLEMAVYPVLNAVAEKVTNDLLPRYGDGLVAVFEDVRPTDRALRLQEIATAQAVLTIDEIRTRYYDLPELSDGRGGLLKGDWPSTAPATPDIRAVKARKIGVGLSEDEQRVYDRLLEVLQRHAPTVVERIEQGATFDDVLAKMSSDIRAALLPELVEIAINGLDSIADEIGLDVDDNSATEAAIEWGRGYAFQLTNEMNETTIRTVRNAANKFRTTPGMTREELEAMLRPAFGARRASVIAITEVTRAQNQSTIIYQLQARERLGIEMIRVWRTNADEKVCPVCGPLNGKKESEWRRGAPPAHPRCRCTTTLMIAEKPDAS